MGDHRPNAQETSRSGIPRPREHVGGRLSAVPVCRLPWLECTTNRLLKRHSRFHSRTRHHDQGRCRAIQALAGDGQRQGDPVVGQ